MRPALFFITLIILTGLSCMPTPRSFAKLDVQIVADTIVPCDARAYVMDHDAAGTNVRSGPGRTFKIVGNLPNQGVEGIAVHITGSAGDWIRIDQALEQGGEQERIFFHGQGWVHTTLLGVSGMAITRGGTNLYEQRMTNSRVVTRVPGGDENVVVRGCRGGWL